MNEKKDLFIYNTKHLNDDSALSTVTKDNIAINTIRDSMEYQGSEYVICKLLMR